MKLKGVTRSSKYFFAKQQSQLEYVPLKNLTRK